MNKWFIAIKELGKDVFDISNLEEIKTSDAIYYADPFLLDGFLFFEDYDHKKGVISCMNLETKEVTKIIEEDWHLSFPCVFKSDGKYYMIPEAGNSGNIWLYEAVQFPFTWTKHVIVPMGRDYADPIYYFKGGYHYLFFTSGGDNNLEVYRSHSVDSGWERFYRNQSMNSRCAGHIFTHEGKLIRPVQNCEGIYGGGIIFKEISFTDASVEEKEIKRINPDWRGDLIGTHTFNFDGKYLVLDGKITL